ncbi:MAG: AraC family transcriptional regulator [Sphingobium sp.]|nr:MAG: AraC family transcriptional regulator [Sphingobium sp.]
MGQFGLLRDEDRAFQRLDPLEETTLTGARRTVGGALSDHELAVAGNAPLAMELRTASVGALPLVLLHYGAPVSIQPRKMPGHFLFQVILGGCLRVEGPGGVFVAGEGQAVVLDELAGRRLHWSADSRQLIMRIPRAAVLKAVGTDSGPIRFDRAFALHDADTGTLELVRYIMTQATSPMAGGHGSAILDLLVRHLLLHHSDFRDRHAPLPASIRRAEAYMRLRLSDPMTLPELTGAVQTTARTLSGNFQRFRGVSPMARFRDMRLDAVHEALKSGTAESVTEAATDFGFFHLGRFSSAYKRRFGESPKQTHLAAARPAAPTPCNNAAAG